MKRKRAEVYITASPVLRDSEGEVTPEHVHHWRSPLVIENPGRITTYFGPNLKNALKRTLKRYDLAVGCVLCITNYSILHVLSDDLKGASFVVQKEIFFNLGNKSGRGKLYGKTDANGRTPQERYDNWRTDMRDTKYGDITPISYQDLYRGHRDKMRVSMVAADPPTCAIRCAGNVKPKGVSIMDHSVLHHKFVVLGRWDSDDKNLRQFQPQAVWEGSLNWGVNDNVDNASLHEDPERAARFYEEFLTVLSFSEPTEWTSKTIAPEFDGPYCE